MQVPCIKEKVHASLRFLFTLNLWLARSKNFKHEKPLNTKCKVNYPQRHRLAQLSPLAQIISSRWLWAALTLLKSPCAARMFHGPGNRLLAALCPGIGGASWLDVSDWLTLLFSSRVVCLCPMSHFFSSLVLFLCTDRHIARTVLFFINFLGL